MDIGRIIREVEIVREEEPDPFTVEPVPARPEPVEDPAR
jgi:hypothetical protein